MYNVIAFQNFELYNPFLSVKLIVWAMFGGFVLAGIIAVYNKRLVGGIVKTILAEECMSPEKAKTVSELGYGDDWFVKNALRTDVTLAKFVCRIDEGDEPVKKTRGGHDVIDFGTARFYIPEEMKYKAEVRYARRGTDLVSFVICVVLFAAAAFAAIYLIPDLIQLIDNFIGSFEA